MSNRVTTRDWASTGNMPAMLTSLIGRQRDIENIHGLLRQPDMRLLTLTGPGGVGRTRLAVRVASELEADDGYRVLFVPLATVADVDHVLPAMLHALDVRDDPARGDLDLLAEEIGDQPLLIVLDNMEQVIDAGAEIPELLAACPALKFLVTSRIPLRVSVEQEYPVEPLDLPERRAAAKVEALQESAAVALFVQRSRGPARFCPDRAKRGSRG
jgi:predicted ATPase